MGVRALLIPALLFMTLAAVPVSAAPGKEQAGRVTIYPAPAGEPASDGYQVFVNGRQTFCYTSFRLDHNSKQTIVGRPVAPVSFCSFDHEGTVEVEVRFLDGLKRAGIDTSKVTVRPLAREIRPKVRNGRIRDVLFKNVRVLKCKNTDVALISDGSASPIEGITFENAVIAGQRLVPGDARIKTNEWVKGVVVR